MRILLFILIAASANYCLSAQQSYSENVLIVGYYGRPGATSLGVLGQYPIDQLLPLVKAKAAEYDKINGDQGVVPAFHLIYGLASSEPGRSGDYILPLSDSKVMDYINSAQKHGLLVIIDLQLGGLTPVEAVQPVLKYLKYDPVHLAIDPEFEVNGLDIRPGRKIGSITGQEINAVQTAMADYLRGNAISKPKMLIVHAFTNNMVKDKEAVKAYEQIDLVMNLDGHGSPELKVKIYNNLYAAHASAGVEGGFKLFFQEDKPAMMTPEQVLGLEPVSNNRIQRPPKYINYQ